MRKLLVKLANPENNSSLSQKFRQRRLLMLTNLIQSTPSPLKIIDVGGRETIWERAGLCEGIKLKDVKITILNIEETQVISQNVKAVVGDAKNMKQFEDGEFDIVFSNSVIEHVGEYNDQQKMANEIKRVGKRYFVQTPNRYFPIEPHFLFPFFQFLPMWAKVWLITHFSLGWREKISDKQNAIKLASSVRLLNKKELMNLFPEATIYEEKFLGLVKSFIVYNGWNIGESLTARYLQD